MDSVRSWTKDQSCEILANHKATSCTCPEILSEAAFKSNRLISLKKEIPRQHTIQANVWLLFIELSQVYHDREQKEQKGCEKHED